MGEKKKRIMIKNEKFVIFKGELAKYQITIDRDDFDVHTCDFSICLSWGMFGQQMEIKKEDMFRDEEWHMFFVFETDDMIGTIKATTTYYVEDGDVSGGYRECTDMQVIGFVTDSQCTMMRKHCKCGQSDGYVKFERIDKSDASTLYLDLVTMDGQPLTTANGERIKVRKNN